MNLLYQTIDISCIVNTAYYFSVIILTQWYFTVVLKLQDVAVKVLTVQDFQDDQLKEFLREVSVVSPLKLYHFIMLSIIILGIHYTKLTSLVPYLMGQMKQVNMQVDMFIVLGCHNETSTSSKCGAFHGCSY